MSFSGAASFLKKQSALEQLLEEINFQRTKEMRQLLKDDSGFVVLHGSSYWTDLFVRHFLFQAEHCIDGDDLLFFVKKKHIKGTSRYLPKYETEVDVYRKDSRKLPIGDPDMDWEETVYLNLIIHQFDYTLTLAICTRTSPKQLQVLRRHSQKVYASPSRRRMDTKGEVEEMTYPHVCFMVDNFNEYMTAEDEGTPLKAHVLSMVFCDILVRDGEMVCVELVASDRSGDIQAVIFLGSIRYDALKRVYDARASMSSKMAHKMTFGLFSNASSQRIEFVRMKGPQGKGHAEMAVTKPKGCGAETPTSEPGYCATDLWDLDWDEDPEDFFVYRHQRRLSDPSANINKFVRGGWRTKDGSVRARSENEGLDCMADGLAEVEAGDVRDDCVRIVNLPSSTSSSPSCSSCITTTTTTTTITSTSATSITTTISTSSATTAASTSAVPCICSSTCHLCLCGHSNCASSVLQPSPSTSSSLSSVQPSAVESNKYCTTTIIDNESESDDEFHDCLSSWEDIDLEVGVDASAAVPDELKTQHNISPIVAPSYSKSKPKTCITVTDSKINNTSTCLLQKNLKDYKNKKTQWLNRHFAPPIQKIASDGTTVTYWCDRRHHSGSGTKTGFELDDGAYNPLWTMRGFTQTFHFWKENKRAQSVPLNAFLTYVTLPWWSIAKDILDIREEPILTF